MKEGLQIIPVSNVREVLRHALVRMPEPLEWDEAAEEAAAAEEGDLHAVPPICASGLARAAAGRNMHAP